MNEPNINAISKGFIAQANAIPNYSAIQLLSDLLATEVHLLTYKQAAAEFSLNANYLTQLVMRGKLKKYGQGRLVRINRFEVIRLFTNPTKP